MLPPVSFFIILAGSTLLSFHMPPCLLATMPSSLRASIELSLIFATCHAIFIAFHYLRRAYAMLPAPFIDAFFAMPSLNFSSFFDTIALISFFTPFFFFFIVIACFLFRRFLRHCRFIEPFLSHYATLHTFIAAFRAVLLIFIALRLLRC